LATESSTPAADAPKPLARELRAVAVWIGLGLLLGVFVAATMGPTAAAEYYAAYVLEKALSLDNMFAFLVIFGELGIAEKYQGRVLWFGVVGALVFRALLIVAGIALIERVDWVVYPFAVLLLLAAWRMSFGVARERQVLKDACNVCETWVARLIRVSPAYHGHDFWRRDRGRLFATPLLVALIVVETTDIVFALDSVPAVLSVTRNPFIVYASNVMAMMGLRSLYFVLAHVLARLRYLRHGLALLLVFTAFKMLAGRHVPISAWLSITIIALVLLTTVTASVWRTRTAE
jgi:tellurite resistance protein TerC